MALWLSRPVVIYPPTTGRGRDGRFDFYVTNSAAACGVLPPVFGDMAPSPDADHPEAETLAAAAVRMALLDAPDGSDPVLLHDCRGTAAVGGPAPSYKLLAKAGIHRTVPLALHGQGGTEPIQAIFLRLCEADAEYSLTVLVGLNWPIERVGDAESDSAAVATAALLGGVRPPLGLRLLGAAVMRHRSGRAAAVAQVVDDALRRAGIKQGALGWSIVHNGVAGLDEMVSCHLSALVPCRRAICAGIDLGCGDLLASLNELMPTLPPGIPGVLVTAGRFDTVAALIAIPER